MVVRDVAALCSHRQKRPGYSARRITWSVTAALSFRCLCVFDAVLGTDGFLPLGDSTTWDGVLPRVQSVRARAL